MTDVLISAADYRAWAAGGFVLGAVMVLAGLAVLVRSWRARERCCGRRIRVCRPCGQGRCYRCDPYGSSDCDRREARR